MKIFFSIEFHTLHTFLHDIFWRCYSHIKVIMNNHNCQTDGICLYLCKILLYSLIYSVMRCHQQLTWDSNIKIRNRFFSVIHSKHVIHALYTHTQYTDNIYIHHIHIVDRRTKLYGKPLTYLPFSHPFSHLKSSTRKKKNRISLLYVVILWLWSHACVRRKCHWLPKR